MFKRIISISALLFLARCGEPETPPPPQDIEQAYASALRAAEQAADGPLHGEPASRVMLAESDVLVAIRIARTSCAAALPVCEEARATTYAAIANMSSVVLRLSGVASYPYGPTDASTNDAYRVIVQNKLIAAIQR